ncbi:non-specific serine/threonine protein kinase [Parastagonospora nodorum]|nr:non-specific serine/threonine protein kinase [Parastagonospora nodorum]KAH5420350.1 non-specific serine/threonine protein kinase [Parastagonospora nodorum]
MAPKKPASAPVKPKPSKSEQSGSVLASLKSSIQVTKDKLHSIRTSATNKVTKATKATKATKRTETTTEREHLKQVLERVSIIDDSSSSNPSPSGPTPDTSAQPSSDPTPHIPLQGPSALTPRNFEVGGSLGKGKFGRVYLARHISTNYICALKIISKASISSTSEETLIRREIEVHQNLAHKNILRLLSWFHEGASIYLVLEYAAGGSLFGRLKKQKKGRFMEDEAAGYIGQMAEALRYMHSKNIMHRDIKPENILLGLHQEVKLADFGYSVHSESGMRSTVCGTLDYLSPEVAVMMLNPGKSDAFYTKAIDRWSLGVLMYELLVGKAPFEMKSIAQTQMKIARYRGKGIKFPSHVSKGAQDLMRGLLSLEAERRMGFEEVLEHEWIKACTVRSVKSGVRSFDGMLKRAITGA